MALKDAVGQRVTVEGSVKGPGVRHARGQTTLLRILAESGGFTDTADQSSVMVFRQTEQGRVVMRYDANAIRVGQAPDPVILGGDTVVVDDSTGKTAWKHFREILGVAGGGVGLAKQQCSRGTKAMNYHRLPAGPGTSLPAFIEPARGLEPAIQGRGRPRGQRGAVAGDVLQILASRFEV